MLPEWGWEADWAELEAVDGAADAWAHHGLALNAAGEVLGFHAGQLVWFDGEGRLVGVADPPVTEGHGITVVTEGDEERIWVADPGVCRHVGADGAVVDEHGPGQVVLLDAEGVLLSRLERPPLAAGEAYAPTSVAVDPRHLGGTGDIWVADGYGTGRVRCHSPAGTLRLELTGEEGAGLFDCPHAVHIDRRMAYPELYITDRGNHRVQVYGLDGTFHRTAGEGVLTSPSDLVAWGDVLVVVELHARVALLDVDDDLLGYVGSDPAAVDREGWPNAVDESGRTVRPEPADGAFNSPHAAVVDASGAVIVAEWVLGGRYTRLVPVG